MAEDWLADVRKYSPNADESVVAAIAKHCGISLQNRDSSLVSFNDPGEVGRVRENFLKKKLGLTQDDATLDASISAVGDRIIDPTANRVTVYYLLAERFGLLDRFGGTAKVAPFAACATAGAATASTVPPPRPEPAVAPQAAYTPHEEKADTGGIGRWLPWILLALLALGLLYALRTCSADRTNETAVTTTVPTTNAPVAVVIPTGAGVIASQRGNLPMLTVYFEVAKSEVHKDLSTAASDVKSYIDSHPNATLAVSGYNDPTGDAAANAVLSKDRADHVRAALERLGIAAQRILLEKPADATGTGDTNAESRRVEVVVKE
jgi:outer membrane protein OmpA-like peptidoglycan-associated protein